MSPSLDTSEFLHPRLVRDIIEKQSTVYTHLKNMYIYNGFTKKGLSNRMINIINIPLSIILVC